MTRPVHARAPTTPGARQRCEVSEVGEQDRRLLHAQGRFVRAVIHAVVGDPRHVRPVTQQATVWILDDKRAVKVPDNGQACLGDAVRQWEVTHPDALGVRELGAGGGQVESWGAKN